MNWRKFFVLLLVSLLMGTPILAQQEMDEYTQGRLDGERDAKGNPLWFLAGAGCGCLGAGAAYLMKPSPPAHALVGKSSNYVIGYTEGYQNKSRNKNTGYACGGWAASVVIYALAGGFSSSSSGY